MTLIPTNTKQANAGRFAKNTFKNTGYKNPNEHKTYNVVCELYHGDVRIMSTGSDDIKALGRYKKAAEKWKRDCNKTLKDMGEIPNADYKLYTVPYSVKDQIELNKQQTLLQGGKVIEGYKEK